MDMDTFSRIVTQLVIYGGGGVAIGYAVFRFLGEKWIENKFSQNLKKLEHDQNVVVARLKVEIESMLSGALKFQEREFVVLPETWGRLDAAFSHISWLVSPIQQLVDVGRLSDVQLGEYLATKTWPESQKQEVRDASPRERTKVFEDISFRYKLSEVKRTFHEYQAYIASNLIFYPAEMKANLRAIEKKLWEAIVAKEVGTEAADWKLQNEGWAKLKEEAEGMRDAIERDIRKRLESHMTAAKPAG